ADIEIPLNNQAKMFSPKIEGRLLDALNIKSHETVLEIGTGSGYLTAVVAKLCQSITSVEINEELSGGAKEKLNAFMLLIKLLRKVFLTQIENLCTNLMGNNHIQKLLY
ncbi:Protein-L-isoaspartate O-methyltransferase (EC, partial [uncultured Gammaproteobacteria bacterium]